MAMAGAALQLRTIAFNAKRCRLRHLGRKLVRDMGRDALLQPLLRCTSGNFLLGEGIWHLAGLTHIKKFRAFPVLWKRYPGPPQKTFSWGVREMGCNLGDLLRYQLMLTHRVSISSSNIFRCFLGTAMTPVFAVKSRKS